MQCKDFQLEILSLLLAVEYWRMEPCMLHSVSEFDFEFVAFNYQFTNCRFDLIDSNTH